MPIPVKIQCGCGQRYAFDVEAAGELRPNSVACPVCGADGTPAANVVIAQALAAAVAPVAAPLPSAPSQSSGIRLAASASSPSVRATSRVASQMTQMDPDKARAEARAKMIWGDSPQAVTGYLRMQGFSKEDAEALVRDLVKERKSAVRGIGMRKILTGIGLICVPIVTLIIFLIMGVILIKVMAMAVVVGLWGCWQALNGTIMILAPKSQQGDLADQ